MLKYYSIVQLLQSFRTTSDKYIIFVIIFNHIPFDNSVFFYYTMKI